MLFSWALKKNNNTEDYRSEYFTCAAVAESWVLREAYFMSWIHHQQTPNVSVVYSDDTE